MRILVTILLFYFGALQAQNTVVVADKIREVEAVYASAYIDEDSTLTTAVLTDAWTFLGAGSNSKFTNLYTSADFTFTGDTLQYIGLRPIFVHLEYGGSITTTGGTTVHHTIFINTTNNEQFESATYCKFTGELYGIPGVSNLVELEYGDKIKIMVMADADVTITTEHFPISLFKINK